MEPRHIRLEYSEALESKRQILTTELNILQISKRIKNYKSIRKNEQTLKTKFRTNIIELKSLIQSIQETFPKHEKLEEPKLKKEENKKVEKEYQEKDIQSQLEEIQRKLSQMQHQ